MNVDDLAQQLGQLNVMQIVELTKKLETAWGVTATPQVSNLPATNVVDSKKEEQTEFNVTLSSYPADKKMGLVKLVRELCGIGLLEAKTLVESAPKLLKEGVTKEESAQLVAKLTEAGGVVTVS